MAKTISQLPDATVVNGSDELIIQQSGVTKRATKTEVLAGIVNANIDAAAAIAGTKISPDFGSQNVVTTGAFSCRAATFITGSPDRIGTDFTSNAISTLNFGSANSGDGNFQLQYNRSAGTFAILGGQTGSQTERMRIDASGNVGIGASSPGSKMDIANGTIRLSTSNSRATVYGINRGDSGSTNGMCSIGMAGAGANGFLGVITFSTGSSDVFNTSLTERMRIDSSGDVGIGTTTPASKLDVGGDISISGTQAVTSRRTGWAAPTGTATRTTFATSTVTTAQLAERVKALIDDLTTHGLIGT